MKQCRCCHKYSVDDVIFCSYCGERFTTVHNSNDEINIHEQAIQITNSTLNTESIDKKDKVKRRLGMFITISIVICVLIIIVIGFAIIEDKINSYGYIKFIEKIEFATNEISNR